MFFLSLNIILYLKIKSNKLIDLDVPEIIIDTDKAIVSWTEINYADGYSVFIDNYLYKNTFSNSTFIDFDDYEKSHIIQIEAYSNDKKYKSSMSKPILYQVKNSVRNVLFTDIAKGQIEGTTRIDIFNNAFFEFTLALSGTYKLQLKYYGFSKFLDEFKIIDTTTDKEINISQNEDNWTNIYLNGGIKYLINLKDLDNEYELVEIIIIPYYESELIDEFNISLSPFQTETIKIKYEEAKDLIFRTKEFNVGVYFSAYNSLRGNNNIANGTSDHIAMIYRDNLLYDPTKTFYLVVQNCTKKSIDITIENICIDKLNVNFDETITVEDSYSIKLFKFTNTQSYSPIYIEHFRENIYLKSYYNSKFIEVNHYQVVKTNSVSILNVIDYLPKNEVCYLVMIPFYDEIIGEDKIIISSTKPDGW